MSRPLFACIDTNALRHNLQLIRLHAASSRVMAVVKANAYGHGLQTVLPALTLADSLAVASVEEALALRELGWDKPILLLEGVFESSELQLCIQHKLSVVVHQSEQVRMLQLQPLTTPLAVFVKLNSGMNRLGLCVPDYHAAMCALQAQPLLKQITQMSHFATADEAVGVAEQMKLIETTFSAYALPVSLANSAAIFRHASTHREWVRPGIALYGGSPFSTGSELETSSAALGLKPVMTLRSRIIAIQTLSVGEALGYGQTWRATRPTRVGVVACGYADGYPRHAPTGTPILVKQHRTITLGRVSMDMLSVDVTGIPQVEVGSPVVMWGEGLPVEDVAHAAGTINYELLCARAQRVPEWRGAV